VCWWEIQTARPVARGSLRIDSRDPWLARTHSHSQTAISVRNRAVCPSVLPKGIARRARIIESRLEQKHSLAALRRPSCRLELPRAIAERAGGAGRTAGFQRPEALRAAAERLLLHWRPVRGALPCGEDPGRRINRLRSRQGGDGAPHWANRHAGSLHPQREVWHGVSGVVWATATGRAVLFQAASNNKDCAWFTAPCGAKPPSQLTSQPRAARICRWGLVVPLRGGCVLYTGLRRAGVAWSPDSRLLLTPVRGQSG